MIDTPCFKLECRGCDMFDRIEKSEERARIEAKNHVRHTGHKVLIIPCILCQEGE